MEALVTIIAVGAYAERQYALHSKGILENAHLGR